MSEDQQQKHQFPVVTSPVRHWLRNTIMTLLILLIAGILVGQQFIYSTSTKEKLQAVITEQTGGQIDYQDISLHYFPRLGIEFHQVTLAIPEQVQATIASLRVSPEFIPLFTGKLHLARIELETPKLKLDLPVTKPKAAPAQPFSFTALEKKLATALAPLAQVIPGLELMVNNAQLAIVQSKHKLFEIEGLNLQLEMSMTDAHSAQGNLQTTLSQLSIHHDDRRETVKDILLGGSLQMMDNKITASLDQLALAEPSLELTGALTLAPTKPAIILKLSSGNIDVDATRRTALALAGDTTPIKEIFDYLRGGQIPQISFTSQGEIPSELGDLNNILIEGRLLEGKVSIPEIELDLTEVIGDVVVSKGVLQGSHISTRLEGSTGQDGSLKVALGEDNDLFQLELMLDADLAKTQTILERVVDAPPFIAELKKITKLQGTGHGRLTLGNSLNDINTKVEISELKLSANYQGVPFPITIAQGQFTFSKKQVDLGKLSGTLGKSKFTDLSSQFLWEKDLFLDISSGRFGLDMTELYPWLASRKGLRDQLKELTQASGKLNVSGLKLKGPLIKPSKWKFSSSGTVKNLSIKTGIFPDTINFAKGGFKVDTHQLSFDTLQTTSQDAALTLTGSIKGFPQQLNRIEILADGRMGAKSVKWLSDRIEVPEAYTIHAPLSISKAQIVWQPDLTTSFKGVVAIDKGPEITAVVDFHPDQLQIQQLTIKDQYSDANIVFDLKKDQRDIKFNGKLQNETLQALFVDHQSTTGQLEGNFFLTLPQDKQSSPTAKGQVTGKNLAVLLSSGDTVEIKQVKLNANGPQVEVDITKATWLGLTWEPIQATVSFDHDRTDVKFIKAKLCGINAPGILSIVGDEFSLDMTLEGKGLDVGTSYTCLREGQVKMTGSLDFSSQITAKGQLGDLLESLQGPLKMTFSKGVIEQDKLVARTLEVLNVTEIVKGRLPNLSSTGFAYTTINIEGTFQNGKLLLPKVFMDGETLDLLGHAEISLEKETIDGQLLAAPFKTIDTVVNKIPGINYILGGGLVTIPVSVTGKLDDPKVSVMSPSAVGTSLLDLAERIFKSPFKLIESIFSLGQ
ncbi:MAG: hypothetical protein GY799_33645 [Desulfobulbaceae bacterium]|nr:hypothetical protein [Desulfobulbaceae bacterium]